MADDIDWDQIAETLGPRLFNYFKRKGFSEAASDLTQETLLRLFQKVQDSSFENQRGSLDQFAFGIARLICLEHGRTVQNFATEDAIAEVSSDTDLHGSMEQDQTRRLINRAIGELPDAQREVLRLCLDSELKLEEISTILEMPLGTVKSHVARAKENLRKTMAQIWENL